MTLQTLIKLLMAQIICLLLTGPAEADKKHWPSRPESITISAEPIPSFFSKSTPDQKGRMIYRGGFILSADKSAFGGISGLAFEPEKNRLTMISDHGGAVIAEISHNNGIIEKFGQSLYGALRNSKGQRLIGLRDYDTESASLRGNDLFISTERSNRIYRFSRSAQGMPQSGEIIKTPKEIRNLPYNKGLEALAAAPQSAGLDNAIIAISERSHGESANLTDGWIIGGKFDGRFQVLRRQGYDVSDAAFLSNGDLVILERKVSIFGGILLRLRQIKASDVKPQAILDGETLLEADLRYPIDNMEGMSIIQSDNGKETITLISDDNFSPLQKTMLLQFELLPQN